MRNTTDMPFLADNETITNQKAMSINNERESYESQPPPTTLLEMADYLTVTSIRESSPSRTHGLTIVITGASR